MDTKTQATDAGRMKNTGDEVPDQNAGNPDETGRLCRLNLAVHGLEGEIKPGGNINSYYCDPRNLVTANAISHY